MIRARSGALLILGTVLATLIALPAVARAAVPNGFVGVVVDGPLFPGTNRHVNLENQFNHMEQDGVENVRVVFDWSYAQPYHHWNQVPQAQLGQFTDAGGIPTRFGLMDKLVGLAAARGITVLPVVLYAPHWDAAKHPSDSFADPKRDAPYAHFLTTLIERYGPDGSFWLQQPRKVPIRMWQIWNEPNIHVFWSQQPFERRYLKLLKAAHDAIKSADPQAKVVLAGMPNFSWKRLAKIYTFRGARRLFDVVGAHPYTQQPQGVITILEKVRKVMNENGDRHKPIIADEISWPSSVGQTKHTEGFDFATTEHGQAKRLAQLIPLLGRDRRRLGLLSFDYYTWAGVEKHGGLAFNFAGLLRLKHGKLTAKPALWAYRRAVMKLEDCRKKGPVATSCARRR
jgi:hypothetical protein